MMTARARHITPVRTALCLVVAVVAAQTVILLGTTASANAAGVAETRVGATNRW